MSRDGGRAPGGGPRSGAGRGGRAPGEGPRSGAGHSGGRGSSAGGRRAPSWLILPSRAAYRLLLGLYPPRLRRRFGVAMRADAARWVDEGWSAEGLRGVARAWVCIATDLFRSVPRAWLGGRPGRLPEAARASAPGDGRSGIPPDSRYGREGRRTFVTAFRDDLRWALRGLRRSPGFTTVVIAVMGLGLGGALTTLVLVDAYLLRGLPYPESERLVGVRPGFAVPWEEADPAVVEHALTWDLDAFTLIDGERPELVRGAWISPGYAEAFGLRLALGRLFRADEYGEGAASVAILSHGLWQRRYGGDPDVVGRRVSAFASDIPDQAESFTIVGVLAPGYWYHNAYTDLLVPLRDPNPLYMARLRPGVPLADAERALTAVALRNGAELPPEGVRLIPFEEMYAASVRPPLVALTAAVGFVLLLACANAAVLVLIRAAGRQHELAIRRAIGAGRRRLVSLVMTEGLLLSLAATAFGLLFALIATGVLAGPIEAQLQVGVPGGTDALAMSARVLLGAAGLTLAVGLAFAAAGAAGVGRTSLVAAVAEGSYTATGGRRRRRARDVLVGVEIAVSFALLVAAALALQSARNLAATELGFDPTDRITAQVNIRAARYPETVDRASFYDRLASEARALPGVESAALTVRVPFGWNFGSTPIETAEGERLPADQAPRATGLIAGPGLLDTLGVALLQGRDLSPRDRAGTLPVAVISRRLAERLWPGEDPLGRRFREVVEANAIAHGAEPGTAPWLTVGGVAGDVQQRLDGEDAPDYYVPYAQSSPTSMTVVMHMATGSASPIAGLEEIVHRMDPEVAVTAVLSLADATLAARAPMRFLAAVLGAFSTFALLLAVLGLHGLVAYAVARRRREVAVRMALGAESADVVGLFVRDSALVVILGICAGIGGAALLGNALAAQLTGVSPWDPATYVMVAALLGGAVIVATLLPARKAATDPVALLRGE